MPNEVCAKWNAMLDVWVSMKRGPREGGPRAALDEPWMPGVWAALGSRGAPHSRAQ